MAISFLHHAQTIAITGRSYHLKYHATIAGKEEKTKKIKSKPNETSTAEPVSWMARFPVLLVLFRCLRLWKTLDLRLESAYTRRMVLARRFENADESQECSP